MPAYRCYFLDVGGHILSVRNIIAETEEEALSVARAVYAERLQHNGFELWQDVRKLRVIDRPAAK